ncbi:aminopeptidase [Nonlabens spongiae]|uniref:Aminopeptidase n=1 Tax=Nonlabens spongiae TaxID=331648 RepID=A0A1W6MP73_9FLAO|nr:aminopeptidase [Nonlabens spongiae]ARN79401.1 aminopeptidase [Nonlabens spongiae]
MNRISTIIFLLVTICAHAQHSTKLNVVLNDSLDQLQIEQELKYHNTSADELSEIYLLDWANAFSSTETPLAVRFAEDFKNRFQFSSDDRKGETDIALGSYFDDLYTLSRPEGHPDVIKVTFKETIKAGEIRFFKFNYAVTIPDDDFTGYGKNSAGEYSLKYWYLHPAVYSDSEWNIYSHKALNDFLGSPTDFKISLKTPTGFDAISAVKKLSGEAKEDGNYFEFEENHLKEAPLYILKNTERYKTYKVTGADVITDLDDDKLAFEIKMIFINRVAAFLQEKLGERRNRGVLISDRFYRENPVYGLSSLPDFINPYPDGFTYEIKILKALTRKWIEDGIYVNPREDFWMQQSLMVYLMMQYQEQYYPDLKISGKLENIWGLRGFNASQMMFNDQYPLLYLNTARINLDQALDTPSDELIKYNEQLAAPYKGALGLRYLNEYLGDRSLSATLKKLYDPSRSKLIDASYFRNELQSYTTNEVDWFFDEYITSHERMDWKIKRMKKTKDSVTVTIKNKSDVVIPVSLYTLQNDSIVERRFINGIEQDTTVTLSRKRANRIAINYEKLIPEFNQRDNYRTLKGFPSLNRPIEFRLIKDVEDPERSQVFLIPDLQYNLYDGITIGSRFYNGNLLSKPFRYSLKPAYGLGSNKLVGSIGFQYTHPLQDRNERLYQVQYGLSGNTYSYDNDLMYRRATGWLVLSYRPEDLRSNKRQSLRFRNVFVDRDRSPLSEVDEPDYNVFNLSFTHSDPNFRRFFKYDVGAQVSSEFSKATFELEWRKLFKDSRQLNFRFYAGTFLHNNTTRNGNFFSFALDRPTDYLFDFNYYGRSEDSGLFSQQLIIAEGGFKSQLKPAFANQWITTANTSYSIWQWIFAYGDAGFVKNRNDGAQFVYDSGIRLNLLQDYFELYFPVYSTNGWEIGQQNYDQKIRFIVSLDIDTFVGLFTRRWY